MKIHLLTIYFYFNVINYLCPFRCYWLTTGPPQVTNTQLVRINSPYKRMNVLETHRVDLLAFVALLAHSAMWERSSRQYNCIL